MNVPVWLEQVDGKFVASSASDPSIRVEAETRAGAIREVRRRITESAAVRELVFISLDETAPDDLFGSMAGDPDLQAICDEAYRLRDEEFRREFPDEGV